MLNVAINVRDTGPVTLTGDLRGLLEDIADTWTSQIQQRTRSGRDADGRPMRKKRDGSRSTLHDSGQMLGSLRADVGDRGFKIAPTGAAKHRRRRTSSAQRQAMGGRIRPDRSRTRGRPSPTHCRRTPPDDRSTTTPDPRQRTASEIE